MKRSIETRIVNRYSQLFGRLALVLRRLGMGASAPTISGIWTKTINGADLGRFDANQLFHSSIADYLDRPELNRYKRSGEPRRSAMLPI